MAGTNNTFPQFSTTVSNMLRMFTRAIPVMRLSTAHTKLAGKQTLSVMATTILEKLPPYLKQVNRNIFNKRARRYLLLKQNKTLDTNY